MSVMNFLVTWCLKDLHTRWKAVWGGRGECGSRQRGSWGAFSRNRALTLGRGAYIGYIGIVHWLFGFYHQVLSFMIKMCKMLVVASLLVFLHFLWPFTMEIRKKPLNISRGNRFKKVTYFMSPQKYIYWGRREAAFGIHCTHRDMTEWYVQHI